MDDNCDLENETLESPITILLFFVIMYFKTGGGIDSVLHCQWMPYVRDPLKASIGRAGYVSPGSPMRTGFTRPDPRSLADYDDNTRTAVVQPWMINLLWYTAAIEQHPSLFQALLHIAQQSDHYDAVTGERQPLKNWFPTESRISRVTKARMKGESCAEETDGENDLDVEPQDETEQLAFGELDTGMPEEQTTKTPDEIKKAQYEQLEQLKAEFAAQDPRRYDSRYVSAAFETLGDAIEAFDSSTFEKTLEKLHTFMETGHEDTTCVSCRLVYRKDPMIKCGSHSEDGWMHNAPACCADIAGKKICIPCWRKTLSTPSGRALPNLAQLYNLGSSCFSNAPLQMMCALKPVRDLVWDTALFRPIRRHAALRRDGSTTATRFN